MRREYWHTVVEINKDDVPDRIRVGMCVGRETKHNGRVPLFDFKKDKETWQYKLKYIGVLDKDLPSNIKIQRIKEWLSQKDEKVTTE